MEGSKANYVDNTNQLFATGLTIRPLADTVQATLDLADTTDTAGLSSDREARLLAAWEGR